MKIKLDALAAMTAQCQPGRNRTDFWDEIVPGFVLECRSSGGKTWYLRYVDKRGRQRQHRIAGYGDVTFDVARKEARRLRSQVTLGGDPARAKEELKAIPTYADFAVQHLANAKTYQRSYATTEMIMRRHIVPRWGKLHLDEIRQQEVAQWLAEKAAQGLALATVEKIRVTFGRSFELALRWNVSGVTRNPTKGITRPPLNNARSRFLSSEETKRLRDAVVKSANPQLAPIVGLLLLTGARLRELLHAEWRHVDLDRRLWLIPTSKTGKARHVPLSQAALDVIGQLPKFDGCPYLVPNPKTRKPYTDIKHPWQTARRLAGLNDVHIHDLRHSAASFMINAGIDLYAVGKVLGHANHASTGRYAHAAPVTLLAAVEAGAAKMKLDWANA